MTGCRVDVAVIGGGLGGVAAALAAAQAGRRVLLTEETAWIGGQLTSQAVPPDEHPWIEQFGCTRNYRNLRDGIRDYYRAWFPLSYKARINRHLNPGAGRVSKLCHEPRVALAVLHQILAPWQSRGSLRVLLGARTTQADVDHDRVRALVVTRADGSTLEVVADWFIDATETGEVLPLTGTEYVTGFESRNDTGEPHAPESAQPSNMQAASVCFAIEHRAGEDHTIDRPYEYEKWRSFEPPNWSGRLLSWTAPDPRTLEPMERAFQPNPDDSDQQLSADQSADPGDKELWRFRRIAARSTFVPGHLDSDITLVNWPMIDYVGGPMFDDTDPTVGLRHLLHAKQLSLSMLYWMQTEAPRPDGGTGYPGLLLRGDVVGTDDGLAMAPYIRESRRIRALYTIPEQDVSRDVRGDAGAVSYPDSVGVGSYRIDLHPSTGGDGYIDVANSPFEIPLRSLIPQRMTNLLPASKNLGTTHITNGCFRLHPVEWNVGEVSGQVAAYCLDTGHTPHELAEKPDIFSDFVRRLHTTGVETQWPQAKAY